MSEVVRLTLVATAMTDAMAAGRFPTDEPLSAVGRRQAATAGENPSGRGLCAPELRARQTAELLGLRADVEPALADLDSGAWRGSDLTELAPEQVARWLSDPAAAPHGGESVVDLVDRVGRWLDSVTDQRTRVVAVTHPAVIRAAVLLALDAPPKSFWRIDIAPVSRTTLHHRGQAWTLRSQP
ncbi:histidine phosphatase family protein [Mycolicibacterium sp.]|uniref:histidine phosphatase family protein n=1 Tax=Mycolicibacterium sp. TaxID=2320850 RepID=UPI003D0F1798